jgi:hypothetical protein
LGPREALAGVLFGLRPPDGPALCIHLNDLAPERTEKPRGGAGYAAIRCGLNSRPFSTTSTTARAASVQRKKPVANGNSVPS